MTILALAIVLVLALTATALLVRDGGHGYPPRSHERDPRFGPPTARLH